jgi:purine-nucleoside phosphorylase
MKTTARRPPSRLYEQVTEAAGYLSRVLGTVPDVAVVLGSGLGAFGDRLSRTARVKYSDVPHWPVPGVAGHPGRLTVGDCGGRAVIALAGRVHLYEGFDAAAVAFPMRVLGHLGVRTVVLTNAAGGINVTFEKGTLMVVDDHINFTGLNPLVGPNEDRFGRRFPDMSEVYSERLRALAREAGESIGLRLEHGVYAWVSGPSYETPAEIRALRALGADAVGMSTVPEAIVLRHMGVEVLAISCISNLAAGMLPQLLSEEEVLETTSRVRAEFEALMEGIVARL